MIRSVLIRKICRWRSTSVSRADRSIAHDTYIASAVHMYRVHVHVVSYTCACTLSACTWMYILCHTHVLHVVLQHYICSAHKWMCIYKWKKKMLKSKSTFKTLTGIYTTIYHAWFFLWYVVTEPVPMWCMWYIVVTSTGPLQVMQRVRVLIWWSKVLIICLQGKSVA